jgi:hypothetical protein
MYLASDTDEGLRAAILLALHEASNRSDRVRYVHDVSGEAVPVPEHIGDVAVVRVPGLDFSQSSDGAERTWRALGDLGYAVAAVAQNDNWSVVLHLSGGFKAAIPYLLVMAEGIRTRLRAAQLPEPAPQVTAVCIHESSIDRDRRPYLVDLPVRYLGWPLHKALRDPDALNRTELLGQFTSGTPVGFTWAGHILTRLLREWP